MKVENKLKRGS